MAAYTDADVQAAIEALIERTVSQYEACQQEQVRKFSSRMFGDGDPTVTTILDAVAPAIAARALREVADSANTAFGGVSIRTIRDRADEIERKRT